TKNPLSLPLSLSPSLSLRDIKPIEHQLRPRGLGLGADRSSIQDLEPGKPKRPPKPGDERKEEEQLVLGPGGFVLLQSAAHTELYGKVTTNTHTHTHTHTHPHILFSLSLI